VSFAQLVAAALLILTQTHPDLASEATLVSIRQADPASPYAGFFDMDHPDIVWINTENVYTDAMVSGQLAHELTHHRDWRLGMLTRKTCGEDYIQAEYRAFRAQYNWQDWADPVWTNYIRAQPFYQRPCGVGSQ
jgi:hypothetical protein